MNFLCRSFMFLVRGIMLRCLQNGFTLSNLFLNSIVRIERFMHLSVLSKYLFGAPPHTGVPYSIYSFEKELQMVLRESCCRQLLSFLRMSMPLFNLLLICLIVYTNLIIYQYILLGIWLCLWVLVLGSIYIFIYIFIYLYRFEM